MSSANLQSDEYKDDESSGEDDKLPSSAAAGAHSAAKLETGITPSVAAGATTTVAFATAAAELDSRITAKGERQSHRARGDGSRATSTTAADSDADKGGDQIDQTSSFRGGRYGSSSRRDSRKQYKQHSSKYSSTSLYLEGLEDLSLATGKTSTAEDFLQNPRDSPGFRNCSWKELDRGFTYALKRLLKAFAADPKQRELMLPAWLSAADRYRVHVVAGTWGLCHESYGEGTDRCIKVRCKVGNAHLPSLLVHLLLLHSMFCHSKKCQTTSCTRYREVEQNTGCLQHATRMIRTYA